MRRTVTALIAAGVTLGAALGAAAPADASIVTTEASLINGQLTIVGSGAVPNSNVSVDDGPTTGPADAQGNFTISASGFSEPSCIATLYDGSVSVEVTLSGCTPTISRPPRVPGQPTLVGPPSGTSATEPVALSWQPPAATPWVHFQWQVSTSPSFTTLALTQTTAAKVTSTTLSGLAPGTYYWRVQSVSFPAEPYNPLFGNWTPTSSLTITGEAPGTPGTPTIESPAPGSKFHQQETFPITWSAVPDAASYRLQLASSPGFGPGTVLDDIPESTTEDHAPLFGFLTPLFIRVFGVTAGGILGLPSPTVAVKIAAHAPVPPPPSLLAPANGATVTLPVTLSWTPDPNPQIEGFQLEINRTPAMTGNCQGIELCVTGLTDPQDTFFSLPPGVHYWRVRSFHGTAATAWSAKRSFTVSNAPPTVGSLSINVFTEGGVAVRSHTHVFSGTNEDNEAFGVVQLTTPAPRGGETVTLASSNRKAAAVPASVEIAAGRADKAFRIRPLQVSSPVKLTLSATVQGQATPATAPLTVEPAALNQVFINSNQKEDGRSTPNIFSGGTPQVGTLLFNGNAPIGSSVTLASSSPAASVPASVTAGGQLVSFTITTQQVTTSTPVFITATWRGKTVSAKMILEPPPILRSPASGASFATGHVVIFRWHGVLSSELQVADNPGFNSPAVDVNTGGAQSWAVTSPLPSGKLYWRVLGVDVDGVDGPPPPVRTFTVRPPSGPLPAPVPEFPANGATVTQGQQVSFFWQTVEGARSYELQVANSSAFTAPLVLDRTLRGNQVNTSKLPAGTLFWRVRALDSAGPGDWSVTFQLTVAPADRRPRHKTASVARAGRPRATVAAG